MLVCLEGLDNSGKSTVAKYLEDNYGAIIIPGLSQSCREIIMNQTVRNLDFERRLISEDRQTMLENVIKPLHDAGELVVLDRYYYSTAVYQSKGTGTEKLANFFNILSHEENICPKPDALVIFRHSFPFKRERDIIEKTDTRLHTLLYSTIFRHEKLRGTNVMLFTDNDISYRVDCLKPFLGLH